MRIVTAVEQLERNFARWLGAPDAVAAGFGRAALFLALRAARVERRNVALPEFVCAQVPEAVRRAGGQPVFYPVRRDLTVCPETFRSAVEQGCGAAILVHYFGRVLPQTERLAAICKERGVPLIEDCALAWGASTPGQRSGTFGDLAAFSFTKSDWCYGGGIVATRSAELLERMREARQQAFRPAAALAFQYGALRRIDFTANRPRWSHAAAVVGRCVEPLTALRGGNFYDAGKLDTQMPEFSARRAQCILGELESHSSRRRIILATLVNSLRGVEHILVRPQLDPGDAAAFLPLQSPAGRAIPWAEEAGRRGVTLRLSWPAYQTGPAPSDAVDWLANHLLVLEIHARLTAQEIERIAATLRKLAQQE